jgi:D-glycero-alpha-D-manno-heptose 1-phosphate guanylyltransferase
MSDEPRVNPLASMSAYSDLHQVPAVLLVGGMGTRLRSVISSVPKPMAPLGERSFLELLVRQLRAQGVRKIVMCTGYLAEQVEKEFGDGSNLGVEIRYSRETSSLGTAGAVKLAKGLLSETDDFLVMNGDSFLEMDIADFLSFHRERGGIATIAVRRVSDSGRYGSVDTAADGRIVNFAEKTGSLGPAVINGGIYVFRKRVLDLIPNGRASLETEVFPNLVKEGIYACEQAGMFIDIGTPQDYTRAQELCERLFRAAAQ